MPVSKENQRCMSQHTHITIVELVYRLYDKTLIFLFFVRNLGSLKHIHSSYVVGHIIELGLGMGSVFTHFTPGLHAIPYDVTSFSTAGPGRTIN